MGLRMFYNFHKVKNPKIMNNSTTAGAREKLSVDFESLEFKNSFYISQTACKNSQILFYHINHQFLLTTNVFTG
jgi:hypothetical protein